MLPIENKAALQFTQEDVKMYKQLDSLLSKNVKWEGSTKDIVDIYRHLVWFAQLGAKIEGNLFDVKSVKPFKKQDSEPEKVSE